MMRKRQGARRCATTLAILATLVCLPTWAVAQEVTLRLGSVTSPNHTETKAEKYFAKLVAEKTDGAVEVQVFSSSQLGSAEEQLEAIRIGAQDMYGGGTGNFGKYVNDWNVTTAGFLFPTQEDFFEALDSKAYKNMEKQLLEEAGFRFVLRNGARPAKPLISKKPIFTPEDMEGLKVRVPAWEGYVRTFEAMGASTVNIPWGETYIALRQGMADVASATVAGLGGQSLHEVAPYLTLVGVFRDAFTIVINDDRFQKLDAEYQKALLEAGKEAGDYYTKQALADQREVIDRMISEGAFVIRARPDPFVDRMGPAVEAMEKQGVWSTNGLYEKLQNAE